MCASELVARLNSRDARAIHKTLTELAVAMGNAGDERPLDQRRASAFGLLADPATALAWLEDSPNLPAASRGRSIIHVHLSQDTLIDPATGVARIEGYGPLTVGSLPAFLTGSHVTVRPVIDDAENITVDAYEIPDRIREQVYRRHTFEAFPYSAQEARGLDLDHLWPYQHGTGWEPGQTRADNLAPLSRRVHRAKTAGAWKVQRQSRTGLIWTSPLGRQYLTTPQGSQPTNPVRRQ